MKYTLLGMLILSSLTSKTKNGQTEPCKGIIAYDVNQRILPYDQDMEIMHPNRSKMIHVALEFLPISNNSNMQLKVLELGIGTGFFTVKFLEKFPLAHIVAIDGAQSMINIAKNRLDSPETSVEFKVIDFRNLDQLSLKTSSLDIVFSSYALHHLTQQEKTAMMDTVYKLLKPGGWFINADLFVAKSQTIEERFQALRVQGIVKRAKKKRDPRFLDVHNTRNFLNQLEKNEGDKPLAISSDMAILQTIGFQSVDIIWKEHREAVICGQKPYNACC